MVARKDYVKKVGSLAGSKGCFFFVWCRQGKMHKNDKKVEMQKGWGSYSLQSQSRE